MFSESDAVSFLLHYLFKAMNLDGAQTIYGGFSLRGYLIMQTSFPIMNCINR